MGDGDFRRPTVSRRLNRYFSNLKFVTYSESRTQTQNFGYVDVGGQGKKQVWCMKVFSLVLFARPQVASLDYPTLNAS